MPPTPQLLQNWADARTRARSYAEALGLAPGEADALAEAAVKEAQGRLDWPDGSTAIHTTLQSMRRLLAGGPGSAGDEDAAFLGWRIERARRRAGAEPRLPLSAPQRDESSPLRSAPPLARGRVVPHRIFRRGLRRWIVASRESGAGRPALRAAKEEYRKLRRRRRRLPWARTARRRRLLLGLLVGVPSAVAASFVPSVLPDRMTTSFELGIAVVFGVLFAWISVGFWTALLGLLVLARRRDRFAVGAEEQGEPDPEARTAIVMPVCDEPVARVFAGLRAILASLDRAGVLDRFDLYVLSDTHAPGAAAEEEQAWFELCVRESAFGRLFYRHRRTRIERKSGNIADFCRRYGAAYRYLVVLDADSVMSAGCLMELVRRMEAHPEVGILQTAPVTVGRRTLFARVQQFASRLYGPLFAAGLHYWQLGDGQYWGHNAIIRMSSFMEHCALPRLPGRPPFGGEILSHDFVEAALMGKAGYALWLAHDLGGSYEESPATLLDEMSRDRRWCQGNLQHLQLLSTRGLVGAHRALFLNGVMSYVSALLWFLFLVLCTGEVFLRAFRPPDYFPNGRLLFPDWPVWHLDRAIWLGVATAVVLFAPKLLAMLRVALSRQTRRAYGGVFRLFCGVVFESLMATLLAPIRMLFHTRFVLRNLMGRVVEWRSQARQDRAISWSEAVRAHALDSALAAAWGLAVYSVSPPTFLWLSPVVVGIVLAAPISVLTSRVSLGQALRRIGLLRIPEESEPPPELRDLATFLEAAEAEERALPALERNGFVRAVVDPLDNAVHCALRRRPRRMRPSIRRAREALVQRALQSGPLALDERERRILLADAEQMEGLHRAVWEIPSWERARLWGRPAEGAPA